MSWKSMLNIDLDAALTEMNQIEPEPHSFTFYTSVSVISSSKIEGEQMEVVFRKTWSLADSPSQISIIPVRDPS